MLHIKTGKVLVDSYWAVCQYQGDYGTLHNHGSPRDEQGSLISGIFYLNVPSVINSNTFPDGCLHLVTQNYEVEYVPPVEGAITIWPSSLIHGIHPFTGEGVRLGIAFNSLLIEED